MSIEGYMYKLEHRANVGTTASARARIRHPDYEIHIRLIMISCSFRRLFASKYPL